MKIKKVIGVLAACALVTGLTAGVGTKAFFTSSATSNQNNFKTGTVRLGSFMNGMDVPNQFASISIDNIKPGDIPEDVAETQLKNVGSLPLKLYRITATEVTGLDDQYSLNDAVYVDIKINNKSVKVCKLNELQEDNGGYFDPIMNIQPGATVNLKVDAFMSTKIGNNYQDRKVTCNLNVFAAQNNRLENGEPAGTLVELGNAGGAGTEADPTFSVTGQDDGKWITFKYYWNPAEYYAEYYTDFFGWVHKYNADYELYKVGIKHHAGEDSSDIQTWYIDTKYVRDTDKVVTSSDGLDEANIKVDFYQHTIKIKKSALPSSWKQIEVQFEGQQRPGIASKTIPWQSWSLNR